MLWCGSVCLCGCCAWSNSTCDPGVYDLRRSFSPRRQIHTSTPVFSFKRKGQSTIPVQMIFIVIFDGVHRQWVTVLVLCAEPRYYGQSMIKALMMSFYKKRNHKPHVDCNAGVRWASLVSQVSFKFLNEWSVTLNITQHPGSVAPLLPVRQHATIQR